MTKPMEVQLRPGWLEADVRKAKSRLDEWHNRRGSGSLSSGQAASRESASMSRGDTRPQSGEPPGNC